MAAKIVTEKSEIARLTKIYKNLPPNKFAVAQGLIVQAARLRVRLNQLWEDIQENGETERFTQSEKTVRTGKTGGQTVHFDGQELSGNYQTAK